MKLQKKSTYGINLDYKIILTSRDIPQSKSKLLKGFSLLELIIAIFVFSLIITTSVAVFANIVSTRKKTRTIQSDMESARTALDLMAKNIREATYFSGGVSVIRMYNQAQGRCVYYGFDSNNLEIGYAPGNDTDADLDGIPDQKCPMSPDVATPYTSIIDGNVSGGGFDIDLTSAVPGSKQIGKATVSLEIGGKIMQTSASFRDYTGIIE